LTVTKTWAEWLDTELKRRNWKQAQLVSASGGQIKADRVSKWLSGKENPSHKLALIAANVFDADHDEALTAAGFPELAGRSASGVPESRTDASIVDIEADPRLVEVSDEDLLRELLRRTEERGASRSNVVEMRPRKIDVGGVDDDEPTVKQPPAHQRTAARKGTRKADQAPHAD
jgi:transcriptional regulator with XRE-family HTH domain